MPRIVGMALVVLLLSGCALVGRTPDRALRQATSALDETADVVVAGLTAVEEFGPVQAQQCAFLPGWPSSRVAWEVGRSYPLPEPSDPVGLVDAAVAHWTGEGARVVYHREEPFAGARLRAKGGRDVFVSVISARDDGPHVDIWVRSRCFRP